MTRRVHPLPTGVLIAAAIFFLWPASVPSHPEKKADPTAVFIAKEWRYPGVDVQISLVGKSQAFYTEQYAAEVDFADVWNHFAAKAGSDGRYKDNTTWAVMGELKAPDKGQFMLFGSGQEMSFGQNNDKRTILVEIRRSGDKTTRVWVVVGVR
jgi:hypothetical protein